MGRIERVTEYWVRVDPRRLGNFGVVRVSDRRVEPDEQRRLKKYRERCEEIVEQIRRHVDNVGGVYVETEKEAVCEYCGSTWTEGEESPHNGGCCIKDIEVYDAVNGLCGFCGEYGADKIPHPVRWPGERSAGTELVHDACEQAETERAHAALTDEERAAFLRTV